MKVAKLPHETLLEWALDDALVLRDFVTTKDGQVTEVLRGLTISERLAALKAAAPFYAPTLKSIEAKAALDLDSLSLDDLKVKIQQVLAKAIKQERDNVH